MQVRVALPLGSYLMSSEENGTRVWFRDVPYGADELLPVLPVPHSPAAVTAREFVRQSMLAECGADPTSWPALVRKFLGIQGSSAELP